MEWQQSPYTLPLVVTGLITFASAVYTARQRHIPGAGHLLKMLLAITIWVFFYILELKAIALDDKLFWTKAEYLAIIFIPVEYLLFVLKYTGTFHKIRKPRQFTFGLLIIPAFTLFLSWTNEWHQLLYQTTGLIFENGLSYLTLTRGSGFWIYLGYIYLLLLTSTLILLRKFLTAQHPYQSQHILTAIAGLFPWVGNVIYITGLNPLPYLDPTPFTFALTGLCFALLLFRFKFLDIVPIARSLVVERLEDGVIVIDGQNRVVDINETAVSLLQKDKKEILGHPLSFSQPQWLTLAAVLKEDKPAKIELPIKEAHYEVSTTLLTNESSGVNGRLLTLHNISPQKKTEQMLQHAKEAAEAADQAKTNFLTNISHEIRTPLNAVVGMAEMLRQTPLNPNQQELLNVMVQSSNNLMQLINNILDFSRLEAGNLTLNQQSFDLVDCVEAALENVRQAAHEKHLALSYQIDAPTPTWLVGDAVRLRHILINLLENSIKFTEEGEIKITISHLPQPEGVQLHFVVEDSGIGIAPAQAKNLFSPFQQIDSSMTRAHGGNGLGLVICKRLVMLMGGDIYLNSTAGQGTAVHFSAQFTIATDNQPPTVSLRHHKATLTNKRLLIITKDAHQRRQISKEARVAGLEVYTAGSCQEASYWVSHSEAFDVVLLDTAVWQAEPDIVNQMRHQETRLPLPIILLSSGEAALPTEVQATVFSAVLPHSMDSSQMYDTLMNVLSVATPTLSSHGLAETMAKRFPLKILVVEDNKLNQRIIKTMLAKLGYHPDVAANGKEAVQIARQSEYDVILMDIQMPVMDGIVATQQILADGAVGKRPYIIAVTAHALEGDREYYLSSGMNEYLSKPVTLNQLVEVLYQSLNQQNSVTENPQPASVAKPAETSEPPIDLVELSRLVGGEAKQFLEMMTPIFLEDTQKTLHTLAEAIQNSDGKTVQQATHSLKGSSASMAMPTLSQYSRNLEMMAKTGDLSEAPPLFQQIQAEFGRVKNALSELVETAV